MRGDAMKTAHRGQKQPLPRDMTTILISIKIRIDLLFIKYHYDAVNQIKVNQYDAVNQDIFLLRLWRLKTTWVKSKINRCVSWGATPHGVLLIPYTDDFLLYGIFFCYFVLRNDCTIYRRQTATLLFLYQVCCSYVRRLAPRPPSFGMLSSTHPSGNIFYPKNTLAQQLWRYPAAM